MNIELLHQSIRSAARVTYSRSGGPGGQNVNKVNSKVTLRLSLDDLSGLSATEIARVRELLTGRINAENEIIVVSEEERSQRTNQVRAFSRLETLIRSSARLPKRRRPTKPSRAAREKRLQSKKLQGLKKAERRLKAEI
ncbi:MAG: aminoacyl-tRNA hydrolase [Treponema sp.]|jgi:ribosome-associated protein|nr:aminoacyl-tRNA hydrolase [Treponema sp.]